MRSFLSPILIIVAIVLLGFTFQCGVEAVSASTDRLTLPESRFCPHCRTMQLVESDLPTWQCDRCNSWFWFSTGKSWSPSR